MKLLDLEMAESVMEGRKFIYDPLTSDIDRRWAGNASDTSDRFNNYYDYYFSGEDIKVFIDGVFDPQDELDIASFAYSVRQEKQPVYGFWSYNHDAVMLGTRLISGEITLFTRHPRRMEEILEKAAKSRELSAKDRANNMPGGPNSIVSRLSPQGFSSDDEKNIRKYWAYSQLDRVTYPYGESFKNIFSAHPPFNFIILYGVEETALTPYSAALSDDVVMSDNLDRMIYGDVNQRTIRADSVRDAMKTVIQQVNLMNVSIGYTPGGQPVVESYQFIARDFYHTSRDLGFVRNLVADNSSDVDVDISGSGDDGLTTTWNGSAPTAPG